MHSEQGPPAFVDVQVLMREVRRRARAGNRERDEALRLIRRIVPRDLPIALARLKSSTQHLRRNAKYLGEIPPGPPTVRARLGAALVRIVQRSMFWLLPPLRSSQQQFADAFAEHVSVTEELLKALEQTNVELEMLRRTIVESKNGETPGREVPA